MAKEKATLYEGQLPYITGLLAANLGVSEQRITEILTIAVPNLNDKEHCVNCGANMRAYEVPFDILNALLLKAMADALREKLRKDDKMDFTIANQIAMRDLPVGDNVKRRSSQLGKLGLIAKVMGANKHHSGAWAITGNGFKALRGEPVRKWSMVFRGEIKERSEKQDVPETITMAEAFNVHRDKMLKAIARHKNPKNDYRTITEDYSPSEWTSYGAPQDGKLF